MTERELDESVKGRSGALRGAWRRQHRWRSHAAQENDRETDIRADVRIARTPDLACAHPAASCGKLIGLSVKGSHLGKAVAAVLAACALAGSGAVTGLVLLHARAPSRGSAATAALPEAHVVAAASSADVPIVAVDGTPVKAPPNCPQLTPVDPPWLVVGPPPPPSAELPVAPKSLERRIAFWLKVWGERGDNQHLIVDERRPWVVHAEVDCRDLFPAGTAPDDADAKTECGGRLQEARSALKAKLKKSWSSRDVLKEFDFDKSLAKNASEHMLDIVGRKDALDRAKTRAVPELGLAEGHFANADVPRLYARAAIVESLWRPEALSRSGAGGVYQFMPKTGRQFLTVDDGTVDERLDPLRAAWAAAAYMAKMAKEFDADWPLVLTAYNTGPARLKHIIKLRHTKDIGKIADLGDIGEFGFDGENYYAQIAAIGRLTAQDRFEPKPILGHAVRVDKELSFSALAQCVDSPADKLALANPALASDVVEGRKPVPAGYVAHVPTPVVTTAALDVR